MFPKICKGLLVAVALTVITSCSSDEKPPERRLGAGDMAPTWSGVNMVDGQKVTFPAVLNDKPAVLVFWATWCPYCKAFMPYAGKIQAEYSDRGVQIITFNAKERGEGDPKAYVDGLGFPLIAIADADAIAEQYDVKFIPGLMVVDGNGRVTYRRGWTDLPAGRKVAEYWADQVRQALDAQSLNALTPRTPD